MNKSQVLRYLPHRDPFLFIDTVQEVILPESMKGASGPFTSQQIIGGKAICTFKVEETLKVLEGHFPGNPILPGVVQVEMMAQASSFLAAQAFKDPTTVKLDVALLGIDSARFRKPIIPPMELEIHAELIKVRGPIQQYDCEIYSNGELYSQSTILASLKVAEGNDK